MQRLSLSLAGAGMVWLLACQPDAAPLAQPTLDVSPPTAPAAVAAEALGAHAILVSWEVAHDDRAVAYYEVLRDGRHVVNLGAGAGPGRVSFPDSNLEPATSYSYVVVAFDRSGNRTASGPVAALTGLDAPAKLDP